MSFFGRDFFSLGFDFDKDGILDVTEEYLEYEMSGEDDEEEDNYLEDE